MAVTLTPSQKAMRQQEALAKEEFDRAKASLRSPEFVNGIASAIPKLADQRGDWSQPVELSPGEAKAVWTMLWLTRPEIHRAFDWDTKPEGQTNGQG